MASDVLHRRAKETEEAVRSSDTVCIPVRILF